jgi:hypothetical protein
MEEESEEEEEEEEIEFSCKNAGNPIIPNGCCYATNVMPVGMPLV